MPKPICDPLACNPGEFWDPSICSCQFLPIDMGCDYIMNCDEGYFWDFTLCGCQKNETKPICQGECNADYQLNTDPCSCQKQQPKCCDWEIEMCTKSIPPQCKCIINPAIRFARDPYSCDAGFEWSRATCGCQPVTTEESSVKP